MTKIGTWSILVRAFFVIFRFIDGELVIMTTEDVVNHRKAQTSWRVKTHYPIRKLNWSSEIMNNFFR
jgi:hypothetical protein